ncbi:MAG: undecaprenyldiphospho-muramoylpentapeptide beta-N-acetylglucosaminyltransferase [Coriobacteriales bacterium]|jgi:UDP-N-acetylglucosamine--N-acetylmuramyl-(pentapeptide) pyrophosphoryl-undecaprenol N-acetylglucosamine transferase|nr:undecaprenyldiphospho-muramoylpentapeptide beta-N-acetylglucosaminyltransferase [Coriobacteriales bacterium]
MKLVVTSGGTAGHVYPALAVADYLSRAGHEVVFAGSTSGMEAKLVAQTDLEYVAFEARGFSRQNPLTLLTSTMLLAKSTRAATSWLNTVRPQAVAAFGGYVSVPVGRAAIRKSIPLVVHEQNSALGWANRYLAKHASAVALSYRLSSDELHSVDPARINITGNPVRAEFARIANPDYARELRTRFIRDLSIPAEATVLLVFGGSQGARHINTAMVGLARAIVARSNWYVIHLTGKNEFDTVKSQLDEQLGDNTQDRKRWKLLDYCDQMPAAFATAELVLARAGASSLAEIAAAQLPALLIPYPYATNNHQEKNAAALVQVGAAVMVLDSMLDSPRFAQQLFALMDDVDVRRQMRTAAAGLGAMSATAAVAELIVRSAQKSQG